MFNIPEIQQRKEKLKTTSHAQAEAMLAMLEQVPVGKRGSEWLTRWHDLKRCIEEREQS